VYLLREGAKVQKEIKERKMFKLSKRLVAEEQKDDENIIMGGAGEKRVKKTELKVKSLNNRNNHSSEVQERESDGLSIV
jgi:hypothetical protein